MLRNKESKILAQMKRNKTVGQPSFIQGVASGEHPEWRDQQPAACRTGARRAFGQFRVRKSEQQSSGPEAEEDWMTIRAMRQAKRN